MRTHLSRLVVLGLLTVGCAVDVASPEAPARDLEPTLGGPPIDLPFDLSQAISRARLAFIARDGSLVGGTATFDVAVGADAVEFSPVDWSDAQDGGDPLHAAPIRLETDAVLRSRSGMLPMIGRSVEMGPLGDARIDRGILVETFRNEAEGTEQSWHFAARPSGAGDLEIRVRYEGYDFAETTREGHHFVDPTSGLHVLYGRAVWVDADGERTDVAVEVDGDHLVLRVPEVVVESSAFPAVLDPTVSPERVVGSPVAGPNAQTEVEVDVAFDGTNFFAVWGDFRTGATFDLYGARINSSGSVLDTRGIAISSASADQRAPAVAWNGSDYLVVWQDTRGADTDLYGQRINTAGALVGGEIAISTATGNQINPDVATSGSGWVVAWEDYRSGTADAYAARVTSSGTVSDATGILLATPAIRRVAPALACNASNCLVAWEEGSSAQDVRGSLLSVATGTPSASIAIGAATLGQRFPSVAYDGTNFLVAWQDERNGGTNIEIYAAGVDSTGTLLDAMGVRITTATGNQILPSVAFLGSTYLIAWQDVRNGATNRDVYGQRVSTTRVLTGSELPISTATGNQEAPSLSGGGSQFFVAWADGRTQQVSGQKDTYGARVTTAGSVLDASGRLLAYTGNRQTLSSVASDGTSFLVTWSDSRGSGGGFDAWGALFNSAGTLLRLKIISAAAGDQLAPDIAFDVTSSSYLVTWHDNRGADFDIYASRVTSTASDFTVGTEFAVSTATGDQRRTTVSANGAHYLVVWEDRRSGSQGDIYAQRVTTAGALAGGEIAVRTSATDENRPSVASDGVDWFVVWSDARGGSGQYDIYGRPVTAGGGLFGEVAISTAANVQQAPAISARAAGEYFVAWADSRVDSARSDLYGTRVSGGTVLDAAGIAISATGDDEGRPAIVTQGSFFLCAYSRTNITTGAADMHARRVAFDGSLPEASFVVSATTTNEQDPALAAAGSRVAISYSRFVAGSPDDTERVRVRFITLSGAAGGQACATAGECDSGFCVDGFCCDTACGGGAADCQACSAALGASADGVCGAVNPGLTCRNTISGCDVAETCTGASTSCPADGFLPAATVCRGSTRTCQDDAVCSGSSPLCPANPATPAGVVCRVADQTCELDATCDGSSFGCPANPVMPAGVFCRAADQLCELDATCNGVNPYCPGNPLTPAGTVCRPDGGACDPTPELCTGAAPQCPADDNPNC